MVTNTQIDYKQMCDNLVSYYKMERATKFEGQVNIPSTSYALELIIQTYVKIGNQPELVKEARRQWNAIHSSTIYDNTYCVVFYGNEQGH